jgi:hypothetical protein
MGAPSSDTPRSLSPRAAARSAIGVGDGVTDGDSFGVANVDGTDTVPAPTGDTVPEGVGLGEGVAVETRVGVDDALSVAAAGGVIGVPVGIGVEVGLSVGAGGWANNSAVARNAARPNAARKDCFGITNWERGELREG